MASFGSLGHLGLRGCHDRLEDLFRSVWSAAQRAIVDHFRQLAVRDTLRLELQRLCNADDGLDGSEPKVVRGL